MRKEDAIGVDFDDYRPKGDKIKIYLFNCLGKCGKVLRIQQNDIKKRSGYCIKCVKRKTSRPFQRVWAALIAEGRQRSIYCDITYDEFIFLTQIGVCYYCDKPINWEPFGSTSYHLDRKNNDQGYTFENVAVCCSLCNRLKSNFYTSEEFKAVMKIHEIWLQGTEEDRKELMYYLVSWKETITMPDSYNGLLY